jgi:hypothetical protein
MRRRSSMHETRRCGVGRFAPVHATDESLYLRRDHVGHQAVWSQPVDKPGDERAQGVPNRASRQPEKSCELMCHVGGQSFVQVGFGQNYVLPILG